MKPYPKTPRVDLSEPFNEDPFLENLKFAEFEVTEKIDGTNVRIIFTEEGMQIKGRTDKAQMYEGVEDHIVGKYTDLCPSLVGLTIYGEAIGPKINKGEKYGDYVRFLAFDIAINDTGRFVDRSTFWTITEEKGIETVPFLGNMYFDRAIFIVENGYNKSKLGDFQAEGLIVRPAVDFRRPDGKRIIYKIKPEDA